MTKQTSPEYLLLGQITRPHGIRGELRMRLLTDYPERIAELEHVYIGKRSNGDGAHPFKVAGMRMHQGLGLLRVDGITDRSAADRLRRQYVMVPLAEAIPLGDDEFYLFQVIGMHLETEGGYRLGTVTRVIETGANDVYVLDSPDYGEVLFPITIETLIEHDMAAGVVLVNIPDGLLPDIPG
jgi:16S rRNA processing protein RimM